MNDNDVRDLLPLLAVDALTDNEREEAEAMIGNRPELQRELDEWRSVLGPLAEIERRDPPPGLRAQVLEAVANTPQDTTAAPVVRIDTARSRRSWALAVAAAAVVALGGAALFVGQLSDGDGAQDAIAAVIEDDDATTIELTGELGGLEVIHSAEEDAAVLTAIGLPAPTGDRVYELWAIEADAADPRRVEIFRPDAQGNVELLVEDLDVDGTVIAITEEPAGGSDAPTSDVIAISG